MAAFEAFLHNVAEFLLETITLALMLLGVSGLLASFIFSRTYGRHCFALLRRVLVIVSGALLLWQAAALSLPTMLFLCVVAGTAATIYNLMFQAEILRLVPPTVTTVATAIYSGIINLGIGGGTYIGGLATRTDHLAHIGYIGAAIALVAALLCRYVYLREALINSALPSWHIFSALSVSTNPPHSLCYASGLSP